MKKLWNAIAKDLWIVLLDIVSVNAAYFLALMIRFYVNFNLRAIAAEEYLPQWAGFAPWYTILCLIVFAVFRLYGGLWKYAGINDMNRIIGASFVTSLIYIVGTVLFVKRMPISYYGIGSFIQFVFTVAIRFSYRALLVEKKRVKRLRIKEGRVLIVGAGEDGRRVLKHLEETDTLKPVAIYDPNASGTMDGIPVINEFNIHSIEAVFVADPTLPVSERQRIKNVCEKANIELKDYTGLFSNLGGRLSLSELLSIIDGQVTLNINGEEKHFTSGVETLQAITKQYQVERIQGDITIQLKQREKLSTKEILAREYAAVLGEEYSSSEEGSDE